MGAYLLLEKGYFMHEARLELPKHSRVVEADTTMWLTLKKLEAEPQVEVYYEMNRETDYIATDINGTITRIAKCPSINGIQFFIPSETKTKVPKSVYELLKESEMLEEEVKKRRPARCIGTM